MAESVQHNLDLKTDVVTDEDEELIDFNLVEAAEEIFVANSYDPLLELTPIIYTTKLDDMQTVQQDLTDLDASEILKKIHSESFPIITYKAIKKKREMDSRRPSFMRVSRVVSDINSKSSKRRKVTEITGYSDNSQQQVRCKPCTVILKDIGYMVKNQPTTKLPTSAPPRILESSKVEVTRQENSSISNNNSSHDYSSQHGIKLENEIESSNEDPLKVKQEQIEIYVAGESKTNKKVAKRIEVVQDSGRQKGIPRKRPRYVFGDSDDDEVPLKVMKKNRTSSSSSNTPTIRKSTASTPKTSTLTSIGTKTDRKSGQAQQASRVVTEVVYTPQEKYYLIVLTNNNDESTIYRINSSKFVTDYYMTSNKKTELTNNELFLASLFPKEEKIIEKFCCWYRREDVISKICARKNFPSVIQKFLRQPHSCIIEDCECCCRIELTKDNNKTSEENWREVIENSLEESDGWIKDVLDINATNSDSLVSKTLSYLPKAQRLEDKKTRESHFNNILLCIENENKNNLSEFELYCIGNNGDVERTLFSNDRDQAQLYQKTYQTMSESKKEIKNAVICCWYKREKLMKDLKMLKASPAVLRYIQKPHNCAWNTCSCCCKPRTVKLIGDILPPTVHHTALYNKSDKMVEIHFNETKMQHTRNKNYVIPELPSKANTTNASTAAVILSDCALKEDNPSLSVDIIDKFKTLKLGVSKLGTLEVILDSPARTLSVQDLKVLSHTITLSTNKMSDLGITAEEFCKRINSKSTEPIQIKDFEATVLRSVESAPTEDTGDSCDNHYDNNDQLDYDETDVEDTNVNEANTASRSNYTDKGTLSTPNVTHVSIPIIHQKPTNPKASLLSALSGLMQTKSKCYVDSFKSFFKDSASSKVTSEKHKKSASQVTQEQPETVSKEPVTLPIIAETFTLKPSSESEAHSSKTIFSMNNIQSKTLASSAESTVKLRVKPVSELVASDAPAKVDSRAVPLVPIAPKPLAAAQTRAGNVTPVIAGSKLNIPTFLIPKNVPIGTTFKLVSKPLSYAPNDGAKTTTSATNSKHVLTLMPNNIGIVRPHLKEPAGNGIMPRLVPILPAPATKSKGPRKGYKKR